MIHCNSLRGGIRNCTGASITTFYCFQAFEESKIEEHLTLIHSLYLIIISYHWTLNKIWTNLIL